MASAIRQMTGLGGDVRKIARLLQKKAPPGHMLAYINQEEADLLKTRGGSGKPHADTGVPSFDTWGSDSSMKPAEFYTEETAAAPQTEPVAAPAPEAPASTQFPYQYTSSPDVAPRPAAPLPQGTEMDFQGFTPVPQVRAAPGLGVTTDQTAAEVQRLSDRPAPPPGITPGAKEETGIGDDIKNWWKNLSEPTKAKLGIGGIQSILAAYQTTNAADQARKYREDLANVAKPYQEQGKQLVAQAQRGELTPAAQQQLQAAQAQAAQGAEKRGGVAAQQAMMAVENMRQQLLQNQYDYGLKVLGIGDNIATGSIKAGMQADQYVNSLAASYANNIARLLAGTPTYSSSNKPTEA